MHNSCRPIVALIATLSICSLGTPAIADTIEFTNGQLLEVVILSENESMYTAQCDVGVISFSRERVTNVTKSPYESNRLLLEKWRKKPSTSETPTVRSSEKDVATNERRIRYGDEWLSENEYAELKEHSKQTWVEKARFSREKAQAVVDEEKDEELIEKTKELIVQGRTTRSSEANRLLKNYDWKHRRTDHFLVFYEDDQLGRSVADKAEYFFNKIATSVGMVREISEALDKRIDIYLVNDKETWEFVLQGKYLPDTPHGFSKIYKKELFIYVENDYDIEFVLPHELSHILLRTYMNVNYSKDAAIPLWLYEGFANFQGNVINLSVSEQLLQRAIRNNSHIPLKELLVINNYPRSMDKKTLFYAEATKLIQYIYLKYGRKNFLDFLNVYLKEYYTYSASQNELTANDGREIMKRVIDLSFLRSEYSSFNSFEENWLKSIMQ